MKFPGAFSEEVRAKARDMASRFGKQLMAEGYRGYFDLDFLIDQDTARYIWASSIHASAVPAR
jgi:hypothetical protein